MPGDPVSGNDVSLDVVAACLAVGVVLAYLFRGYLVALSRAVKDLLGRVVGK
jgi:hypothetical protein